MFRLSENLAGSHFGDLHNNGCGILKYIAIEVYWLFVPEPPFVWNITEKRTNKSEIESIFPPIMRGNGFLIEDYTEDYTNLQEGPLRGVGFRVSGCRVWAVHPTCSPEVGQITANPDGPCTQYLGTWDFGNNDSGKGFG